MEDMAEWNMNCSMQARGRLKMQAHHVEVEGLNRLTNEHAEIQRGFALLDESITRGRGLEQILAAAESLTHLIMLHFVHETQFLEKVSPAMLGLHRRAKEELMTEIADVDLGLLRREQAAAMQLRNLWKIWRRDHIYGVGEAVKFMFEEPVEAMSRTTDIQVWTNGFPL